VSNFPQIFGVSNFPLPPLTLPFGATWKGKVAYPLPSKLPSGEKGRQLGGVGNTPLGRRVRGER